MTFPFFVYVVLYFLVLVIFVYVLLALDSVGVVLTIFDAYYLVLLYRTARVVFAERKTRYYKNAC